MVESIEIQNDIKEVLKTMDDPYVEMRNGAEARKRLEASSQATVS
jgi:hypothetical protein